MAGSSWHKPHKLQDRPALPQAEEALAGNVSAVIRVGNSVHRSVGPWSPAVHAVLQQLERAGFEGAPRFSGLDEQGREVLSFIAGETIGEGDSPNVTPARLESAARLLRRLHDVLAGFMLPAGVSWHDRYHPRPEDGSLGVCHMDAHPQNTIFCGEQAVAFIDWDMAGLAPRLWDVAWSAWSYVPLADDERCRRNGWPVPPDRYARLRSFCDAYDLDRAARELLPDTAMRLARNQIVDIQRAAAAGVASARWLVDDVGYPRIVRRQIGWIKQNRAALLDALR